MLPADLLMEGMAAGNVLLHFAEVECQGLNLPHNKQTFYPLGLCNQWIVVILMNTDLSVGSASGGVTIKKARTGTERSGQEEDSHKPKLGRGPCPQPLCSPLSSLSNPSSLSSPIGVCGRCRLGMLMECNLILFISSDSSALYE